MLRADPLASPGPQMNDRWNAVITWAAVSLVAGGLLTILVVSILTARANQHDRVRLTEEVGLLADSQARLHIAVTTAGSEAKTFALTGGAEPRARYDIARSEYDAERTTFLELADDAGYEREAGGLTGAADRYAEAAAAVVAAADRGDPGEAARIAAEEAPQRFGIVMLASSSMDAAISAETASLRDDLADAERRNIVVLALGMTAAAAAALLLVWLAYRNRRLLKGLESEQGRLTDVVANVPGVVWETRGEPGGHRPEFVSEYVEALTGYSVADWLGDPALSQEVIHPDDRARVAEESASIYRRGAAGTSECRWTKRNGDVIDVLTYMTVVRDEEGRAVGMRGVTIDITDRVRAENAARLGAQVSALLFSSLDAPDALKGAAQLLVPQLADWCAVHLVDDDGVPRLLTVAHADPARVEWAGELRRRYAPDGAVDAGVVEVVRSGKPALITDIPDEALIRTARDEEQLRILREVGMRSYICAPMIARGRVLGAITLLSAESGRRYDERDLATAQDLAWRAAVALDNARLYQDVESERARFASIVASVAHAVLQIDARGRLVYMNPAAEQLLAYSVDELRGTAVHGVVHPEHEGAAPGEAECAFADMTAGSVSSGSALDAFARKDGTRFDVELTRSPIVVEGRPLGAVLVFQDVTERLNQERMKDDFLAFASHELRSPLTTVNGIAKWLEKRVSQIPDRYDPETREAIETLSQGADRMGNIVELFLDLARIDSDRLVLESQDLELSLLLLEETNALAIRYPQAKVETQVPDRPVTAQSDEDRLRQVLTNLLDNAVKYGGDPPRVLARLEVSDDAAVISVRDNGRGIPDAEAARIFERFYRGAGEETRRSRGLGIGLFLAREIVDRVGGKLTFTSGPDGTEFRVWLPLVPDMRRPPGPKSAPVRR